MKIYTVLLFTLALALIACQEETSSNENITVTVKDDSIPAVQSIDTVVLDNDTSELKQDSISSRPKEKTAHTPTSFTLITPSISKPTIKTGLDSVFQVLSSEKQTFKINSEESNFIEGKEGTVLYIPQNAFGDIKNVKLTLKESYSKSSYLFNCLSTQTANGENLETAGMIELKAFNLKNEDIKLADGKSIKIHFPTNGKKEKGFRLFNEKLSKDSVIEWKYNINETPDIFVRTITYHVGNDLMSFYTGQNNLDYLSAKEVEILQRRMDVRFNTEFFMRTNKMVDSLMTFKRDGYEDDLEFYNILRKVSDNLKGKHTKLLPKLKENARVYFEFRDKNDTLSQKDYTESVSFLSLNSK